MLGFLLQIFVYKDDGLVMKDVRGTESRGVQQYFGNVFKVYSGSTVVVVPQLQPCKKLNKESEDIVKLEIRRGKRIEAKVYNDTIYITITLGNLL